MAVTLISTDGLFTRLGKLFDIVEKIETHQSTLETEFDDVLDEYNNDRELASLLTGSLLSTQKNAAAIFPVIRSVVMKTIIEMVNDDTPLANKTIHAALAELAEQMIGAGDLKTPDDSLKGQAVTTSVAYDLIDPAILTANIGNVISEVRHVDTLGVQTARAEDLIIECIQDTQQRGTEGRDELFRVRGEAPILDIRDPNWPGGSGIDAVMKITDPSQDQGSSPGRNVLKNSDFRDITTNVPDNWAINTGVAGTHIGENTTSARWRGGAKNLKYIGDGSTLMAIEQVTGSGSGTSKVVKGNTQYVFHLRAKKDATVAAGVLKLQLVESDDTVIQTEEGTDIEISVTLSGLGTTNYDQATGIFKTPSRIPAGAKLLLATTTAITNTGEVYIEDVSVSEVVKPIGVSGPRLAIYPGYSPWTKGDKATVTVTNALTGKFYKHLDRFLNLGALGIVLPFKTSGETVSDSLIS